LGFDWAWASLVTNFVNQVWM